MEKNYVIVEYVDILVDIEKNDLSSRCVTTTTTTIDLKQKGKTRKEESIIYLFIST